MLSRHFLRAKALQTVYAGVTNQTTNADDIAKAFDSNVLLLDNLGIIQLGTLSQLAFTAERIMESEMQKFSPQETEVESLRRIAENQFITKLDCGFDFKQQQNRVKFDWSNHFDVFRKILNNLKTSKQFNDYMRDGQFNFDADREIALVAFKYLMNDQTLRDIIYDRELLWEDDFDQIAQYVYMLIKEPAEADMDEAMLCLRVYNPQNQNEVDAYSFARQLAIDTFKHIDDVEPMIRKHLQNWDFERVALMDILIINMAVCEFTTCPSIPERVTVDEYIELSKEFSTEKSKLFINGILDKILIELRVAGRVNKDERGMYDPEIDNSAQSAETDKTESEETVNQ